jgi:hypothetical protein
MAQKSVREPRGDRRLEGLTAEQGFEPGTRQLDELNLRVLHPNVKVLIIAAFRQNFSIRDHLSGAAFFPVMVLNFLVRYLIAVPQAVRDRGVGLPGSWQVGERAQATAKKKGGIRRIKSQEIGSRCRAV